MTKRNTSLLGHLISEEMLDRLNNVIGLVNLIPSMSEVTLAETLTVLSKPENHLSMSSIEPVITEATATVFGKTAEDAYLHVELIRPAYPYTQLMLDCPLANSKLKIPTINKNFGWRLSPKEQRTIQFFFSAVAQSLQFKGEGLSIEESQSTAV